MSRRWGSSKTLTKRLDRLASRQECSESSVPEGLIELTAPQPDFKEPGLEGVFRALAMKRRNTHFTRTVRRAIGGFTDLSNEGELETSYFSWLLLIELYS